MMVKRLFVYDLLPPNALLFIETFSRTPLY